jgi:hypothetical protein
VKDLFIGKTLYKQVHRWTHQVQRIDRAMARLFNDGYDSKKYARLQALKDARRRDMGRIMEVLVEFNLREEREQCAD